MNRGWRSGQEQKAWSAEEIDKEEEKKWIYFRGDPEMFVLVQQVWEIKETSLKGGQAVRTEMNDAKQRSELNKWSEISKISCDLYQVKDPSCYFLTIVTIV